MTISEQLDSYYRTISADPHAERELIDVIAHLAAQSPQPTRSTRHAPERRRPSRPTTLALIGAVSAVIAVVVLATVFRVIYPSSQSGRGTAAASRTPVSTAPPSAAETTSGPSSGVSSEVTPGRHVAGWIAAVANNTRGFPAGWVTASDFNDVEATPTSPRQAITRQQLRGPWQYVAPVYQRPSTRARVLGGSVVGNGAPFHSTCPDQRGLALRLSPPANTVGATTPIAAARTIQTRYGINKFGTQTTNWMQDPQAPNTVTAGSITLNLRQLANGTWVIVRGEHCL